MSIAEKSFINKLTKNQGGVALLMTLLILSSILVVVLMISDIITSGIKMSKTQAHSTRAYFAAEAGAERVLWDVRKNSFAFERADTTPCQIDDYIEFSASTVCNVNLQEYTLSNNAKYSIVYASSSPWIFRSIGSYNGTRRAVEVSF